MKLSLVAVCAYQERDTICSLIVRSEFASPHRRLVLSMMRVIGRGESHRHIPLLEKSLH
jgi:hypothetical protein